MALIYDESDESVLVSCTACQYRDIELHKAGAMAAGVRHVNEVHPTDYNAIRWAKQRMEKTTNKVPLY